MRHSTTLGTTVSQNDLIDCAIQFRNKMLANETVLEFLRCYFIIIQPKSLK